MTREQLEGALDSGHLYYEFENGRQWRCRRNGQTKTWKTRPTEFRVPIKMGFRDHHAIDHRNQDAPYWIIKED